MVWPSPQELETELSHTLSVHGMAPPHPAAATTAVPAYSTSPPPARSKSPSFPKPKRFQRERSTSYREKKSRKESKPPRRHSYGGAENVVSDSVGAHSSLLTSTLLSVTSVSPGLGSSSKFHHHIALCSLVDGVCKLKGTLVMPSQKNHFGLAHSLQI